MDLLATASQRLSAVTLGNVQDGAQPNVPVRKHLTYWLQKAVPPRRTCDKGPTLSPSLAGLEAGSGLNMCFELYRMSQ
jgi:hypothetical protein